jgi:hypothetical protein
MRTLVFIAPQVPAQERNESLQKSGVDAELGRAKHVLLGVVALALAGHEAVLQAAAQGVLQTHSLVLQIQAVAVVDVLRELLAQEARES